MMRILVLILVAVDCIVAAYLICRWLSRKQKSLLKKDIEWALDAAYEKFCTDHDDEIKYCPYCGKKLTDPKVDSCPACGHRLMK